MKFCEFCGAPMEDNVNFCGSCGKQQTEEAVVTTEPAKKSVKLDPKNIKVIGAAVVVVLVLFFIFGGRGPEKTVKQYMKATLKGNAKKIVKLMPKDIVDEAAEQEDMTKKELIEELDETLDEALEYMEDYKISYEIDDVDDIKGEELSELKDELKEMGLAKKKVKAAKEVEVEVSVREKGASKDEAMTNSTTVTVVKIGRNWYLAGFGSIF